MSAIKNESDNAAFNDGYTSARDGCDPLMTVADGLFGGFYGDSWNEGYKQGEIDRQKYGPRDD